MPTENQNADPATSLAAGHDLNQWKLVPVEPTETMVIDGFESEPDECFTDEGVLEQYRAMSGCQQAAFRAKLCWAAMLAAAPVPPQADLDRVTAERDALQISLNTADQSIDELNAAISRRTHRVRELEALLAAADEQADALGGLLLQTNELLYAIQGDPGAVPSSSIDAMRGRVFEALKRDRSTSVLHPQNL
ncbi:hypothetical protein HBO34_05425 [Pseudomonas veronii]|uniref:hypothetical protein n=1 Tax=Pseudomonas veronii TaxID=76761 RepID=UPI0014747B4B|nr:hypothetical protein [Pseudomonas veronii]NMX37317.1 hypothetical protein [Pseudomonas veronii]